MKILIEDENWVNNERIFAIGHFFYKNEFFESQKMLSILNTIKQIEELNSLLAEIQGYYSFIILFDDTVLVVTDRIRSYPIFWSKSNSNEYTISDSPYKLISKTTTLNNTSEKEIRLTGYITGNTTIFRDIFQTQAGLIYFFQDGNEEETTQYATFPCNNEELDDRNLILQKLREAYLEALDRMIVFLNGRQAVIPLSGGLDSRFIVSLLRMGKYKNILAFTYGRYEKDEVRISKNIASFLGIKWVFIPYKNEEMQLLFYTDYFDKMISRCALGISSPVIQDWYAINFLKKNNLIHPDAVIIPGHAVTSIMELTPAKVLESESLTKHEILDTIFDSNYVYSKKLRKKNKEKMINKINTNYQYIKNNFHQNEAYKVICNFSYNERQAKYITNSVRVYEFEGFAWYLPFWDKAIINIWSQIPVKYSKNRSIYSDLISEIFPDLQISVPIFGNHNNLNKNRENWKKKFVKKHFPNVFTTLISLKRKRNHNLNLDGYVKQYDFIKSILAKRYSYVDMWCEKYIRREKERLVEK